MRKLLELDFSTIVDEAIEDKVAKIEAIDNEMAVVRAAKSKMAVEEPKIIQAANNRIYTR
ncbi:unnamed protein product [Malus baccata var. baccata]